jgi:hypothetical protein
MFEVRGIVLRKKQAKTKFNVWTLINMSLLWDKVWNAR